MPAKPAAPTRSSSFNKLFPDGGEPVMPSKFLQILPWLCVIEAFGLIFYNLAEAAHLMFPLMQPSAEFLAAMKIPAVGTMYSCLWVGHAVGDGTLGYSWYKALKRPGSIRQPMLQAAFWDLAWACVLIPTLVRSGCWCLPYGVAIGGAAGAIGLGCLYVAIKEPFVLEKAKRA